MIAAIASPMLDTWKDAEFEVSILRKNTASGALEPATGLTGATFRVSATEQGAAIGTLTGIVASERSSTPGTYSAVVDLATLTAQLPAGTYPHDAELWLQLFIAGDVQVEAWRKRLRRTKFG